MMCDKENCIHLEELGRQAYLSEQLANALLRKQVELLEAENEKLREALRWYTAAQEWS